MKLFSKYTKKGNTKIKTSKVNLLVDGLDCSFKVLGFDIKSRFGNNDTLLLEVRIECNKIKYDCITEISLSIRNDNIKSIDDLLVNSKQDMIKSIFSYIETAKKRYDEDNRVKNVIDSISHISNKDVVTTVL